MHRLAIAVVALLVIAPLPVTAHGNYLEADTQTSADGSVTIELLTVVTDGFVVLHEAHGDEIGPVVGHTDLGTGPIHTDLTVDIEDAYWQNVTNHTTLYAVLHRNEGSSGFDPAEDPIQESAAGDRVATRVSVGKTDGNRSIVLAEADHAEEVNTSTVSVRHVSMPSDGYLVIRANDDGTPGEIVGRTRLPAGTHEDVHVDIDDHFYSHRSERFSLWAVIHHSDGDETFDPDSDTPVTVNGAAINTQLSLHRTDEIQAHDHGSPTATQTASENHDSHDHTPTETPSPTPTANPTATTPQPTPSPTVEPPTDSPTSTSGQTPGFTIGVTFLAVLALSVLANRFRR